jgi:uncharacterized damage-inducible protein DinB
VRSLPAELLTEQGVSGQWSVKDIVGHVATWDKLMQGILQGDPEARRQAVQNVDAFNAAEAKRKRKYSTQKALRELEACHAALRDMLESSPPEVFSESYEWRKALHDDTHLHYAEHAADIERWYERVRKDG